MRHTKTFHKENDHERIESVRGHPHRTPGQSESHRQAGHRSPGEQGLCRHAGPVQHREVPFQQGQCDPDEAEGQKDRSRTGPGSAKRADDRFLRCRNLRRRQGHCAGQGNRSRRSPQDRRHGVIHRRIDTEETGRESQSPCFQ